MSAIRHASDIASASPPRRESAGDWPMRALYGGVLAVVGIFVTVAGGTVFAGFVAVAGVAAAREWHRLVRGKDYHGEFLATASALVLALAAAVLFPFSAWPLAILAAGAAVAAWFAGGGTSLWSALGAFYIGVPSWSLVALRLQVKGGLWIVLGIFLVIWTADTGALIVGRLTGGPKLVPTLSPNKTWAGFVGGVVLASVAGAVYVAVLGGSAGRAFAFALLFALAGHAGDLFESWVKRCFGIKNSGALIPGHGGVLDRLDSTFFVAPLAAALVLGLGTGVLFGVTG